MYKLLLIFALGLTGCDSSSDSTTQPVTNTDNTYKTVNITGIGTTTTINETDKFDLNIEGIGNTITIERYNDIATLNLTGNNNQITFERTTDVDTFNITGNDNTIFVDASITSSVTITNNTGSGNQIIVQ